MSIPQICPSCENHISAAHAPGCCYGTPEYAHIGWPDMRVGTIANADRRLGSGYTKVEPITMTPPTMEELSRDGFVDSESAIRRLLAYLQDEPEDAEPSEPAPNKFDEWGYRLANRAEELRKEAAGMYNIEARAKRNFAADVLDALREELA